MVLTVFRSRLHPEQAAEYAEVASRIRALAENMPGLISFKTFKADDGERVSIIEFESEETLRAWREHPEHRKAQELGRTKFYAEFQSDLFHHSPVRFKATYDECNTRKAADMSVKVYGCNHVAIEVDDVEKAVSFYQDVFNLEKLDEGEGDAFFKLGEHQFLAIFKVNEVKSDHARHFGIMVRDEQQLGEVREKLTKKYGIKLIPPFRCDFRDPFGNRIQVVDLHDESLVWLLPYREVQKAGIKFAD